MKTKLSKRVIACLLVTVMVLGVFMAIPASGEFVAPDDWVERPDPTNATWDQLWSWDREGTGLPDPDDENEGLPFAWGTHNTWTAENGYAVDIVPTVLQYDKSTVATTVKAGDVVWVKVDVGNVNTDIYPTGFFGTEYLVTFDDRLAFPFMLPGDSRNGMYYGELYDADYNTTNWFEIAFKKNVKKPMDITDDSKYNYRYYNGDLVRKDGLGLKMAFTMIQEDENVMPGDISWWFPIQISENAVDGEKVTFTIPYPTETGHVTGPTSDEYDQVQLIRGGAISVTVSNYEDVAENLAAYAAYSLMGANGGSTDFAPGVATDLLRPLTPNAEFDTVYGDAKGEVEFRAPGDVENVKFTFNTSDTSDIPTSVNVWGIKADGTKVELGTVHTGVAVNAGVENNTFDWTKYPFENFTNWTDDKYKTVNASNAYTFTLDGFDVASYTGIYFEATAVEGKGISLGEIEVAGEFSKYAVDIVNGTISNTAEDGKYASGTVLNISTTTPADSIFTGWTVEGDGVIADATALDTTFTVGSTDATITANFKPVEYTLTVIDGTGTGDYAKGTVVDITAAETSNDQSGAPTVFSHWEVLSGDAVIADASLAATTVTTNGVATIKAVYKLASYNLTVMYGSGDGTYEYDEAIDVVAETLDEKIFSHWKIVSGVAFIADENAAETFVRIYEDTVIEAVYVDKVYSFEVVNGTASLDGTEFKKGTELTIIAEAPVDGTYFAGWEVTSGDAEIADASSISTTVITSNQATVITAKYEDFYTVDVTAGTVARDDGNIPVVFAAGEIAVITAEIAPVNYTFYKWEVITGAATYADGYSEYDAKAKLVVNDNVILKPTYIPAYAPVPENLALGSTVSVLNNSMLVGDNADGALEQIVDGFYPLLEECEWPWILSDNGTVQLMFSLDKAYEINKVVVDAGFIANNNFSYLPNGITVYGSNSADGSYAVELVSVTDLCTDVDSKWTNLYVADGVKGNSYLYTLEIPEKNVSNYQYVIVEFDCSWVLLNQRNSHLRLGEVEIYGTPAKYIVETIDATIDGYESGSKFEAGTVLTIVPNANTVEKAFDGTWTYCGAGVLDAENMTWTVGTGDAAITANFVDINKDAPDNLAPGADVTITDGIVSDGTAGYVNDQIYALYTGAKWTTLNMGTNGATLVFDLKDYYDLTAFALEFENKPGVAFAPNAITVYGANASDGSDKAAILDKTNVGNPYVTNVDFDFDCGLTSTAKLFKAELKNVDTFRYVIVELTFYDYIELPINVGEVEIYGTAAASNLTVENGTATPVAPEGGYDVGDEVTITANELADKTFIGWTVVSGDVTIADPTAATTTATIGFENSVIKAEYADILYDVDVVNGAIDADDVQADGYVVGTEIGITAQIIKDKIFVEWKIVSGNGTFADKNASATTFTTGSGDTVIEAVYKDALYKVTVQNGTVENANEDGYVVGTVVTIVADAPEAGKKFVAWEIVSGTGTIADPTAATTTVTVGSGDVVIKAVYADIPYKVTVENGAIDGVAKEEYFYGDVVTIIANAPEANKVFAGWTIVSGEGAAIADSDAATTTVTVGTSDVVVRADYADILYDITIDGGYIAEDDYNEDGYVAGTVLDITANTPAIGTKFVGWEVVEGDAVIADPKSPTTTLTVGSEGSKINAIFVNVAYTLTVMSGKVEEGAKEEYFYGDVVTIVADDIEGKEFTGWTIVSGEGATLDDATSDTTTLKFGADDVVVQANYKDVTDTPITGDSGFAWYLLLVLIAICGVATLAYNKKRCR